MTYLKSKCLKYIALTILGALFTLSVFSISITMFDDPLSQKMRELTENQVNQYIESLLYKASQGTLTTLDRALLHTGLLMGLTISWLKYPEASMLLYHAVYGDGSTLELPSSYFERSPYLQEVINKLGEGQHGPITLEQARDWRLSLALNPYYLTITSETIRLYHPSIIFASIKKAPKVVTIVPIGKLKLKVYDNLVSVINSKPFYVYSEWLIN